MELENNDGNAGGGLDPNNLVAVPPIVAQPAGVLAGGGGDGGNGDGVGGKFLNASIILMKKMDCTSNILSLWCLILEPTLFLFTKSLVAFKAEVVVAVEVVVVVVVEVVVVEVEEEDVEEEDPIMLGEMQRQQLEETTLSCTSRTKLFKRCSVETSTLPICVMCSTATSAIERRRPSITFLFLRLLQMPAQQLN